MFSDFRTVFDSTVRVIEQTDGKHEARRFKAAGYGAYYDDLIGSMCAQHQKQPCDAGSLSNFFHVVSEYRWLLDQRPTFKVYDDYAEMLSGAELNFPIAELMLPFPANVVLLPNTGVMQRILGFDMVAPESVMISELHFDTADEEADELVFPYVDGDVASMVKQVTGPGASQGAACVRCLHVGVVYRYRGMPEAYIRTINWRVGGRRGDDADNRFSLERLIDEATGPGPETTGAGVSDSDLKEVMRIAVRAACGVMMLAVGSGELVEPEVLQKDIIDFARARDAGDYVAIERMVSRANGARDYTGFAIGRSDHVLGRRSIRVDTGAQTDGEGRPLRYRHVRRAHFHTYRHGPGRSLKKRVFTPMVIVRPDLPPAPDSASARSYRTPT